MSIFSSIQEIHAVGIDIGQSAIKVVQLRCAEGKVFLESYGSIELGPYGGFEAGQAVSLGDEKILEAIEDVFKASKISTKNASLSLDAASCFVSCIEIPHVEKEELNNIVPLEARKYIPIPISEVQLDFWLMPQEENKEGENTLHAKDKIVLAAVTNAALEKYTRIATKLGIEKPDFEIESFSFLRTAHIEAGKFFLFLDIGSRYSTVFLVKDDILLDMHVIGYGSQNSTMQLSKAMIIPIALAEENKRKYGYEGEKSSPFIKEIMQLSSYPLFGEVTRLLLNYERKYNQVVEGIIVGGGGARAKGLLDTMSETIHTPVRLITPFETCEIPEFFKEMTHTIGPSYAIACGLALHKIKNQK